MRSRKPLPCTVVVEGVNDAWALRTLLVARGVNPPGLTGRRVDVTYLSEFGKAGGVEAFAKDIPRRHEAASAGHAIGFVFDADDQPAARAASMLHRLRGVGLREGATLGPEGLLEPADHGVTVGCWMMPDNAAEGAIEAVLLAMVSGREGLLAHARAATAAARAEHGSDLRDQDVPKAELQAFLAWQKEPNALYGVSVQKGLLNAGASVADGFVRWVERLLAASEGS